MLWLFIFYCIYLSSITYLAQSFLFTENIIYNSYGEQLSYDRIEEIIDGQNRYAWVGYAILPFLSAVKFFLVACCLLAGASTIGGVLFVAKIAMGPIGNGISLACTAYSVGRVLDWW